MSAYYELGSGAAPWGDYGHVLWSGFTEKSQERNQPSILVSRTGPFVPPITLPFASVLVTDEFREKLSAEGFSSSEAEIVGAVSPGQPRRWNRSCELRGSAAG